MRTFKKQYVLGLDHDTENDGTIPEIDVEKVRLKGLKPPVPTCSKCKCWAEHIVRAGISRKLYRSDAEKRLETGEPIYAADLQKAIMLPQMPGMKTAVFTRRIIAFNETFAPVGGHGELSTQVNTRD